MIPSINIPFVVTLPNIKAYLSNNFFSAVTIGADVIHVHPTFELVCSEENGSMKFIITPPLVEHKSYNSAKGGISSLLFSIDATNANAICNAFLKLDHQVILEDTFEGSKRINNIKQASCNQTMWVNELIVAELNLLFVNLAKNLEDEPNERKTHPQSAEEKYIALIDYYFNVELNDPHFNKVKLANELNVSERHLTRILDKVYHNSFSVILTQSRMNFANTLLSRGEMTIEEIAFAAGYNSVYSFRRAYKKNFGHSPIKKKQNRT